MSENIEDNAQPQDWVELVRSKITNMRSGSIQLVIHEGRVTQVGSTEKFLIPDKPRDPKHRPPRKRP